MLRFQHIEYLWLWVTIVLIAALFLYATQKRKKSIQQIGDEQLVLLQMKNFNLKAFHLKLMLVLLALFIGIIGLANLQARANTENVERKGIDVMIALDVSKSMLAKDESPNRIEKAKLFISKLVDKIPNNKVGLIVFAGRSYVSVPLTVDMSALKMNLATITPDAIPTQGTVLSEAIKMARESFNAKEAKFKSIVLISDGEDHDAEAIKETKKASEEGIVIHTIGIGSETGAPIWDEALQSNKKDADGNEIISKLNSEELQNIATESEGTYRILKNIESASNAVTAEINQSEKKNFGAASFINYKSYFQYFLLISLILICIEFFISDRKKTTSL